MVPGIREQQSSSSQRLSPTSLKRQQAMGALALADVATLEDAAENIVPSLRYTFLRQPETGLVMIEGRAGNTGKRFHLGEMLVTRCVLRLESSESPPTEGYAFIQGNNPRHAELAALFDALLQQEAWAGSLEQTLIKPLLAERQEHLARLQEETATTKVDFFTLVRGEDE